MVIVPRSGIRLKAMATAIAVIALGACELSNTVIPRTTPAIVIHAVLNTAQTVQQVLVERSLTGTQVTGTSFDPDSPIAGNGIPISGAVVTLTDSHGLALAGVERRPASGVYEITLDPSRPAIVPGERYNLSVSAEGTTVTGSTVVPLIAPNRFENFKTFNRDHDSVHVDAPDTAAFRGLWATISTPFESFSILSADRHLVIDGQVRNPNTNDLLRVFYPGWQQTLTVVVADTNVYDYYRSGNDPFTGTGLISHLSGGLGLFGSVVQIAQTSYDVIQDPTGDPIEGRYTRRVDPSRQFFDELTLFLNARGKAGDPDQISGWTRDRPDLGRGGLLGTRSGTDVRFTIANRLTAVGTARGDTVRLTYIDKNGFTLGAPATFVRLGK
jgi:hypothetical protein